MKQNNKLKSVLLTATLGLSLFASANIHPAMADTKFCPNADDCNISMVKRSKMNTLNYEAVGAQGNLPAHPIQGYFVGQAKYEDSTRVGQPSIPYGMNKWLYNPQVQTVDGKKNFWNRGHLVGNQFAGMASNDGKNIVPETEYMNQVLMTHYEGTRSARGYGLNNWLHRHPNDYLEYKVTPNYKDDEIVPRSVTLEYCGLKDTAQNGGTGTPVHIIIPKCHENGIESQTYDSSTKMEKVVIDNIEPGYEINYKTGDFKQTSAIKEQRNGIHHTYYGGEHYHHYYGGHHYTHHRRF